MSFTHDYTQRAWGHDYTFTPQGGGKTARMQGWGTGIKDGDFLVLRHPEGGTTRYQIKAIRYYPDPPDMWTADVVFAPRGSR